MWAKARKEAPVFFDDRLGFWTVTRFDDVLGVLRDPVTFSSASTLSLNRVRLPDELAARWPEEMWDPPFLVTTDPPAHTPLRKAMQKAFTPRRVSALEPFIRATCDELVDAMLERGSADLMVDYANALTLRVITKVLGFDPEMSPLLRQWTEDLLVLILQSRTMEPDQLADPEMVARFASFVDVMERTGEVIEARRRQPRDDLITALVQAAEEERLDLDDHQLITLCLELGLAGNETTASLIGHLVYYLQEDRSAWDELLNDRALVSNAVEEGLRRRGSSNGLFRIATRDVTIGEAEIKKGDMLHVLFSAAGHDEEYFEDPRKFDIHRFNAKDHVSFGRWTHFCLGAPLARFEAAIALECLLERVPNLRVVPGQDLEYLPAIGTHTLLHLSVEC